MTRKDLKLSGTSKNLIENLVLWEELDDKTGEKISGGATFRFNNTTVSPIPVTLIGGETISISITPGTSTKDVSGNQIIVEFDNKRRSLTSNQTGTFVDNNGTIEFRT